MDLPVSKGRRVVKRTILSALGLATLAIAGCGTAYEADPVSVYQWDRRQQEIERQDAERQRLCQTLDKQSARYQRDCAGVRS